MRELKYAEALREALAEEMRRDERVFVFGEDVELGYAFTVSKGLQPRRIGLLSFHADIQVFLIIQHFYNRVLFCRGAFFIQVKLGY